MQPRVCDNTQAHFVLGMLHRVQRLKLHLVVPRVQRSGLDFFDGHRWRTRCLDIGGRTNNALIHSAIERGPVPNAI
jgi:hypothetical protein